MGGLETEGCKVTPYLVDFRTGESTPLTEYSVAYSLLPWGRKDGVGLGKALSPPGLRQGAGPLMR
jgi:hypothetical protein